MAGQAAVPIPAQEIKGPWNMMLETSRLGTSTCQGEQLDCQVVDGVMMFSWWFLRSTPSAYSHIAEIQTECPFLDGIAITQ